MAVFKWLHLTDLHIGMSGEKHLWPNVRDAFFKDLDQLHKKCGPWDVVLFTGDLTQQGRPEKFKRLDGEARAPLWDHLRGLGSDPALLAVPGNHDLQRPKPSPAIRLLLKWADNPEIHEEFWEQQTSDYRQAIAAAFAGYNDWWRRCPYRASAEIQAKVYPEINPAGRFAVHLFGHMHENVIRSQSHGGGPMVRQWQGPSLFAGRFQR